jgi:lipopolysaccharide biosynthesis regulator YciM
LTVTRPEVTAEHLELLADLMTRPKENQMDQMAADHARDYRVKGLFDNARHSLNALLEDEDACRALRRHMQEGAAAKLAANLADESAHIVAAWD